MEIKAWSKRWIILLSGLFLFGCATTEDAKVLDERIYQLQSQLSTLEKEKNSLSNELNALRKEAQANISARKKEDDLLRTALATENKKLQDTLSSRLENLQSQLSAIEKEKDSLSRELTTSRIEAKAEDDLLRAALTTESKKVQDALSLRLENLQSQLSAIEKEKDSLSRELNASRIEAKADISPLKKENDLLRTALTTESKKVQDALSLRLENLQSQLSTIQKEKDSLSRELNASRIEAKAEDDLLRAALTTESKKVQDALSLRLENLQSQLSTIQKEKNSLSSELTTFRMETQANLSTLKKEDDLLRTTLPTESKKVQDVLSLRLENLQYEIRIHSTAVEEYRDLLQRTSKEIDRLKDQIAMRTKVLEESEKILEGKNIGHEDRLNALEERIRGTEDRFKGLDEKIAQIVLKQEEMGKMISEAKETANVSGDLYRDAYETLQKGDLVGAQRKFESFLKQYPYTEFSDNAQFWIGEIYYLKKDFEKAVLEYEKVIAKYPEGDKIPVSLFKQALAFLELGDKKNAKNLLKRVVDRYPYSEEGDIAKKKLQGIK
jgi:tol-pal system protein YbgF